ncbi:unnamed protein product, partial [Polarella glacialis]
HLPVALAALAALALRVCEAFVGQSPLWSLRGGAPHSACRTHRALPPSTLRAMEDISIQATVVKGVVFIAIASILFLVVDLIVKLVSPDPEIEKRKAAAEAKAAAAAAGTAEDVSLDEKRAKILEKFMKAGEKK